MEGVAEEEDCPARQPTSDERAVQLFAPGAHCSVALAAESAVRL